MDKKIPPVMDLPDFKLKKVGKEREKRKTGMPWFPQMGRAGQGALATGGRGVIAAFVGSRIGLMMLMAVLTAGSWGLGKVLADAERSDNSAGAISKPAKAEKTQYDGDLTNLPGRENRNQSGLGMVSGSLSAPKPAEEATAEEAPAADASAEAGDAPAAGEAPADEALAAGAAEAAGQTGPTKASPFGARPGGLAGLSGLSGGAGLSGGISRSFGASNLKAGKLTAPRASTKPARATAARSSIRNSMARSLARRQLSTAHQFGRGARKGSDENRSSNASSAFENNAPAGTALTGAGIAEGAPQSAPVTGSGSGSPSTSSGGDGDTTKPITCGTGTKLSADGATCVAKGSNKDPAKPIMDIVKILTYALVALLLLQALSHYMEWTGFNSVLRVIIGIVSAALLGLGVALMAMGRPAFGAAAALTGGLGLLFAVQGDTGKTIASTTLTYTGLLAFLGAAAMSMGGDKWDKPATKQDWG